MDPNYPQNPNPYPAAVQPTSTMALVSLIASILGLTLVPFLGSIVGVIAGMMARKETRGTPAVASGDGLATAGIVLGWVGIGLAVFGTICAVCLVVSPFALSIPFLLTGGGSN